MVINGVDFSKQDFYLVRHYSHVYIASKVKDDGDRYAYYRLLRIHQEYKPGGVSVSTRGTIYIRSNTTNNYVGTVVRKDKNTVDYIPGEKCYEILKKEEKQNSNNETIGFIIAALIIAFVLVAIASSI